MTKQTDQASEMTSEDVRKQLVDALRLDLVGPGVDHPLAEEQLSESDRPSSWYLTGFLIPSETEPEHRAQDVDDDDDLGEVPDDAGLAEESHEERKAAKKVYFPSSVGLSFYLLPAARQLTVDVSWGDYALRDVEDDNGETSTKVWQRTPRRETVTVPVSAGRTRVPDSDGIDLEISEQTVSGAELGEHLPSGLRAVSIFVVNRRMPIAVKRGTPDRSDEAYVFQPRLVVRGDKSFVEMPDLRGALSNEWDDAVANLQYADTPAYAVGHGISTEWDVADGACTEVKTAWIPTAEVEATKTVEVPDVNLSMTALGALPNGAAMTEALRPLGDQYRQWIRRQRDNLKELPETHLETAQELLRSAETVADRIDRGVAILDTDEDAQEAFRMANRAVARALQQRQGLTEPRWRAFQLAFILLNLPGITSPEHRDRELVDLLFFPTGGGKTEAYLGLSAFAMVLRRLRHAEDRIAASGVTVMMRYTLRLLTLDQFGRAAGLVCALELERRENPRAYGDWPFEIGLWVGKAATPNILGERGDGRSDSTRAKVKQFKDNPKSKPAPIPLQVCPWCQTPFRPQSFTLHPDSDYPKELRIVCTNSDCDFTRDHALPIVVVDEQIYRRLPAFLIATVDKYAALPWLGTAGVLLGGADRHDADGFYGAGEPRQGQRLSAPLAPPDLVIQDELHLISGPLGTMAGLYETAIARLATREINGKTVRPKIVASTATARRASAQVQALFARPLTQVFPAPGPDRRDSFFAKTAPSTETPARLYLGLTAQGRSPKHVMRRVWLALMGAAERCYRDAGGERNKKNVGDPYMSVLGYFNSLRELGGARRILEEEVQNTVRAYGSRMRIGETQGMFADRKKFSEVVELTSRVPINEVDEARRRLAQEFHQKKERVDCAIATNMISVGLDIQRLGLMVVMGQPKTHAEYIQATSRVGRDPTRPGLVVTLCNFHRPRDRSHYERFRHYHQTFYRSVEGASMTPFSARALDRGLAGVTVGLARHLVPSLTPPDAVAKLASVRVELEQQLQAIFRERVKRQPINDPEELEARVRSVQERISDLLDSWIYVVNAYREHGVEVQYQKYERKNPKPLLREILDTEFESVHHRKFRTNRSLRDVEPEVNLIVQGRG